VERVYQVLQSLCEDVVISVKIESPCLVNLIETTHVRCHELLITSLEKRGYFVIEGLFVFVRPGQGRHALYLGVNPLVN